MAFQPLIDGLAATPNPDAPLEQWTTTGIHRLARGDVINLTRSGPVQSVVVLAVEPIHDDTSSRDVMRITARRIDTGEDVQETRPSTGSVLARCDMRYEPIATADEPAVCAEMSPPGSLADDFFGEGVYQPEMDPAKIAAAEKSIAAIRERLNQPRAW